MSKFLSLIFYANLIFIASAQANGVVIGGASGRGAGAGGIAPIAGVAADNDAARVDYERDDEQANRINRIGVRVGDRERRRGARGYRGPRVGVQVGYQSGPTRLRNRVIVRAGAIISHDPINKVGERVRGVVGGVHAGYDFDLGEDVLFGIEGALDLSNADGHRSITNPEIDTVTIKFDNEFLLSLMARLGIVYGDTLVYAAGGWVGSSWSVRSRLVNEPELAGFGFEYDVGGKTKKFLNGFRSAIGISHRIENFIFGFESSYAWFEKKDFNQIHDLTGFPGGLTDASINNKFNPCSWKFQLKASYLL